MTTITAPVPRRVSLGETRCVDSRPAPPVPPSPPSPSRWRRAAATAGTRDTDSSTNDTEATTDLSAELTWWDTSDPDNEAPAYDELIKKFNEEYPDITIKHEVVPFDQTQNKFKTAAEADSGAPDILRAEVAWTPEFASLGYLYALDGTAALENNFLETPLSSNVYEDKTYGVPQVTDTLGLMYNKALFEKAGLDPEAPPTTWDEVREAAKALKSKAKVDGLYINSGGYFLLPFLYGEGADLVDTDAETITVNSPEAVTGIETAQSLVEDGTAVKPTANDPYGTMMTLFKEQKVAMIINGPWEVAGISDDPKFGGIDNLGVAPVPAGGAGQGAPVGGHNYVVYSGMDDQKAEAAARVHRLHELGRVRGVHRRRAGPAARQRRLLRHGDQRARGAVGRRHGGRPAASVDPRGWTVLRRARHHGHPGAHPGQARPAGPRRGGRHLQERRGPRLLAPVTPR